MKAERGIREDGYGERDFFFRFFFGGEREEFF
jgi:hypothetical protein